MSGLATVSVNRLAKLHKKHRVDVLDVRTPMEFQQVHVINARSVPLDALDPHAVMKHRNGNGGDPLYVICGSGNRSSKACRQFLDAGYTNVVNVEGGTRAWDEAGLPVVRGREAISLERQVRIAAGFFVLAGAILGLSVHPYFVGVSAFIGAGLMFAGITDTCGMGMMLAKMPWNQVHGEGKSCGSH